MSYVESISPGAYYKGEETREIYPKGCYVASGHAIYFNHDKTGSIVPTYRSVCIVVGEKIKTEYFLNNSVSNIKHSSRITTLIEL